jgi:hypothetical protein
MLNTTESDSNAYKFGSIILKNYRGETIDIKKVVSDFAVTESIYSLFDIYELTIGDGTGLMELYGLTCNEKIEVTIFKKDKSDKEEKMITKKLVVIEITDYNKGEEMTQTFKLRCLTESAFAAATKRLSRSVSGSIDQILKTLTREVIKDPVNFVSSQSLGNFKIVIPNLTYTETFALLTKSNVLEDGSTAHLYETLWHDFIYRSYSDMVNSKPKKKYKYTSNNKEEVGSDKHFDEQITRVKNISSSFDVSLYSAMKDGVYHSKVNRVDPSSKTYEVIEFNLFKSQTPHISKHPYLKEGSYEVDTPRTITHIVNSNAYGDETNIRTVDSSLYAKKVSTFSKQFGLTHTIEIDGVTEFCVGDTIEIQIPPSHGVGVSRNKEDTLLSGKFLVTNIRHAFTSSGRYTMSVDIKKDTIDFDILPRPDKGNTSS